MNIVILDDEEYWREIILSYVKEYFDYKKDKANFYLVTSFSELLDLDIKIDLILLDIQMEEYDGIKVKNALKKEGIRIIFVSNYSEKIDKSLGKNVYGYVKKSNLNSLKGYLEEVCDEYFNEQYIYLEKKPLLCNDVIFLKAEGAYTWIFLMDKRELFLRKNIGEFEKELPKRIFMRVHKSYIVNLKYIKTVFHNEIVLDGGEHLHISKGSSNEVKKRYLNCVLKEEF